MRQRKCDSCQVPARVAALDEVEDEGGDEEQHARLEPGHDGADRDDRVQRIADVPDRAEVPLRVGA